jgi:TonB family protein
MLPLTGRTEDPRRWPDASKVTPFYTQDPRRWGTPYRVVEPEYPKAAVADGRTGVVEVDALVTAEDKLKDIRYAAESPEATVFVEPLKAVLPHWLVRAPLGSDCLPTGERVVLRIWFELKDGAPKVSVSRGTNSPPAAQASVEKALSSPFPVYPRSMRAKGNEAVVYTLSVVDPSGDVREVHTRVYSEDLDNAPFEPAVVKALRQWKYPPEPNGVVRHVCKDVHFRIVD